ncbi:50S ribosomal protein L13 [Candidatus Marsarchaeota archaeon]|nr:50S ribosomal protein L13 [Candidatus Marsarchaeota archaeon]
MSKIIDGEGKILGRTATQVAKLLLSGEDVTIINAEKMLISGHAEEITERYKHKLNLRDKANPEHSPHISRRPDFFVKRVIRGMLPRKQARGRDALKRLTVYMGSPAALKGSEEHKIDVKDPISIYERVITIGELSSRLGYKE